MEDILIEKLEAVYGEIPLKMFDFVLVFLVRHNCNYKTRDAYNGIEVRFVQYLSHEVSLVRKIDLIN